MKKVFAIIVLVIVILITTAIAENGGFLCYNDEGNLVSLETFYIVIDYETGVNYILYRNNWDGTCTICPRYNTDGTIYSGYSD
jgi:hypothetical protein